MSVIAIMGNGPVDHLPNIEVYRNKVDCWIGVDRGALVLLQHEIPVHHAIGDFDSVNEKQKQLIMNQTNKLHPYPSEKNQTDLEIALEKALEMKPNKLYVFGATGGRLDHGLVNIQLLHQVLDTSKTTRCMIIDKWNQLELTIPGTYSVTKNDRYPYISFIPFTNEVENLTLKGFYYHLENYQLAKGSTRCISNELASKQGSFSYDRGMLLFIQSRDSQ